MTCKSKYDLFIFLMLYLALIVVQAFGQQTTMYLGNKQLAKENNKWYILENDSKFEVNERSMTVKFKENVDKSSMDVFGKEFSIKIERENELGYIDLEIPEGTNFKEVYDYYIKTGLFESVEVNSYGFIFDDPDDTYYGLQHYLDNVQGYTQIYADVAWEYENGSSNPVIAAVIDVGVDDRNDDIYMNSSNYGYNYIASGLPRPADNNHHGTGIAGIIGAKRNNDEAIAGVAGGDIANGQQGTKIMSLRVGTIGTDTATISSQYVDDAILYAANNGARVINMSFGVSASSAINAAIEYAYGTKKCFLVGSNHNNFDGQALPYPARHKYVFAVGGVRKNGTEYSRVKSNDKDKLDICAPAEQIYSTQNATASDDYACKYYYGCSFAAPQAVGAAALLYSYEPSFIHVDIKNIIRSTANDNYTGYNSNYHGQGLLDIGTIFDYLDYGTLQADIPQNVTITTISNKPKLSWSSVSTADKYVIYRAGYQKRYNFEIIGETTSTNYTDNSVVSKSGVTYYYRVASVDNNFGTSITSVEKSFTTGSSSSKIAVPFDEDLVKYEYSLADNYPNPFNPSTTIKYSLKEDGIVNLTVYNILGEKIIQSVNEFKTKGNYSFNFNASSLSSGVYFYKISVNDYTSIKKMVVTK